jgi:hypothetical protein
MNIFYNILDAFCFKEDNGSHRSRACTYEVIVAAETIINIVPFINLC